MKARRRAGHVDGRDFLETFEDMQFAAIIGRECPLRIEVGEVKGIAEIEVGDGDAVEMGGNILDFGVANSRGDDVGAAAGPDQIVVDAAADGLARPVPWIRYCWLGSSR